jgi:hypothetical protein
MGQQIISSAFKTEDIWKPKNPSHKNVTVLHKLWLGIAQEVGKCDKQPNYVNMTLPCYLHVTTNEHATTIY